MSLFISEFKLNSELENIFEKAERSLILISPYIKLHHRLRSSLIEKIDNPDLEITIVFGKNKDNLLKSMKHEEFEFFSKFPNIEIRFEPNLHAKYYANEKSAIITSMNLYDFSQDNNIEAGVLTSRKGIMGNIANSLMGNHAGSDNVDNDAETFFEKVINQSQLLFKREPVYESTLLGFSNKYISSKIITNIFPDSDNKRNEQTAYQNTQPFRIEPSSQKSDSKSTGYCIRTRTIIPFNTKHPMCETAYESWKKFSNNDYAEKYCHFSGEPSNGQTSFAKPILRKYWRKAQEIHGF